MQLMFAVKFSFKLIKIIRQYLYYLNFVNILSNSAFPLLKNCFPS